MTRHERLVEHFEDSYFALLMEEVAQKEGERLEQINQELQDNPAAAIPEDLDRRCLKTIDRYFARQRRGLALRWTRKGLRLTAVITLTAILLLTTAFAVSEKFRLATLNLVLTITEEYTQFDIRNNNTGTHRQTTTSSGKYFENAEIGWMPDGFEYNESESICNTYIRFENGQCEFFYILLHTPAGSMNVDTENPDSMEHISINGNEGLCILKNQEITIVLADLTHDLYIEIGASIGVTVDTTKKIAENICIL